MQKENEKNELVKSRLLLDNDIGLDIKAVMIDGKGRGVVAKRDFEKTEFIVEYKGKPAYFEKSKILEIVQIGGMGRGVYAAYGIGIGWGGSEILFSFL